MSSKKKGNGDGRVNGSGLLLVIPAKGQSTCEAVSEVSLSVREAYADRNEDPPKMLLRKLGLYNLNSALLYCPSLPERGLTSTACTVEDVSTLRRFRGYLSNVG